MTMIESEPELASWIGRTERHNAQAAAWPLDALSAALDRDDAPFQTGDSVPSLWHWLLFPDVVPQRKIGHDGHPVRGGFLPPVPLPRRMWAGGRLSFHDPLRVGDAVVRASSIRSIEEKEGRTGRLVFVTVEHRLYTERGLAIQEEQDIVYRLAVKDARTGASAASAPVDEAFAREVTPDPVLLFRYSALTFSGHRIHYDRCYAVKEEGYPGLVVHGPLVATLILDLVRRTFPDSPVGQFEFKAVHPLFDLHPFSVCGRPSDDGRIALWVRTHDGRLAMNANAHLL